MNQGGEAADQMVRESLQCTELAIKLTALGFKNTLALALAYAKENPKVRGKTSLDRLLREGKELKVISLQAKDLNAFTQEAKHYGVLFAAIRDKNGHGETVDILFKAEDVSKLNRIYERLGYTVPQRSGRDRKNEPTRHPSVPGSQVRGKVTERSQGAVPDARPSVRAAIRRLREAAQTMAQRAVRTTSREER